MLASRKGGTREARKDWRKDLNHLIGQHPAGPAGRKKRLWTIRYTNGRFNLEVGLEWVNLKACRGLGPPNPAWTIRFLPFLFVHHRN